nr:MAG TPA: hypothetical protein [Caudoviricetes sp.]
MINPFFSPKQSIKDRLLIMKGMCLQFAFTKCLS